MQKFEHYDIIKKNIEDLICFLNSVNINADVRSHLENDYLTACKFYSDYIANHSISQDEGRSAFMGLYELYKWIWTVKDLKEFEKLKPHLSLLIQASPRINSFVPMINPVTGKQDDKTNKFIEAIVGFFAIAYGSNVDLDDPVTSSNGENPDVIFTFEGQRTSIACKTLRSIKPTTIFENIKSGAKQISKSNCQTGYVLLNVMNIIEVEHGEIRNKVFNTVDEPIEILRNSIESIYNEVLTQWGNELDNLFKSDTTVCPIIITVLHSTTKINSQIGVLSTSLKTTLVTNFSKDNKYENSMLTLPTLFNNFIHNC